MGSDKTAEPLDETGTGSTTGEKITSSGVYIYNGSAINVHI